MRVELGKLKTAPAGEIKFFLERDEKTGEYFYVRVSPKGGALILPLAGAQRHPFYQEALETAQALIQRHQKHGVG